MYIIKIETSNGEPCYIAPWIGDPGRTLMITNAERFKTREAAQSKIDHLHKSFPLRPRKYTIKQLIDTSNMI